MNKETNQFDRATKNIPLIQQVEILVPDAFDFNLAIALPLTQHL